MIQDGMMDGAQDDAQDATVGGVMDGAQDGVIDDAMDDVMDLTTDGTRDDTMDNTPAVVWGAADEDGVDGEIERGGDGDSRCADTTGLGHPSVSRVRFGHGSGCSKYLQPQRATLRQQRSIVWALQ